MNKQSSRAGELASEDPAARERRDGNVALTCRHFGLSRKTFYKWKKRFDGSGDSGLADQSRRPLRSPHATPPKSLARFCTSDRTTTSGRARFRTTSSASTACLSQHHRCTGYWEPGLSRLPANQKFQQHAKRWKRYEKARPGHRLQMDVKFLERIPGRRRGSISSPPSTTARGYAS